MQKELTKQEILDELQSIQSYMEEHNAFHGYGQMIDLIKRLETDCAISNVSNYLPSDDDIINESYKQVTPYGRQTTVNDRKKYFVKGAKWMRNLLCSY
jgi:hypothetical protein